MEIVIMVKIINRISQINLVHLQAGYSSQNEEMIESPALRMNGADDMVKKTQAEDFWGDLDIYIN